MSPQPSSWAEVTVVHDGSRITVKFETGKSWRVRDFIYIKLELERGARFSGASSDDYELKLGDGTMLTSFEKQVDECIKDGDVLHLSPKRERN